MIKIEIDVEGIAAQFKEIHREVEADLQKGVKRLASSIWAKILEDSQQELHTTRDIYREALSKPVEMANGVYLIALQGSAMWIEEGIRSGYDMKEGLLKNAKTYPSGKRYKVVPFQYNKAPSSMTGFAKSVSSQIQRQLSKRGIPYQGIETGLDNKPRNGRLWEFNWGGAKPGKGNTPVMQGVNIYQNVQGGNVRRDILTFRTVTEDQKGKWIHPGIQPHHFFERAEVWGRSEWEHNIEPDILEKWTR